MFPPPSPHPPNPQTLKTTLPFSLIPRHHSSRCFAISKKNAPYKHTHTPYTTPSGAESSSIHLLLKVKLLQFMPWKGKRQSKMKIVGNAERHPNAKMNN